MCVGMGGGHSSGVGWGLIVVGGRQRGSDNKEIMNEGPSFFSRWQLDRFPVALSSRYC